LIHRFSARASGPFVATNIASIPARLLESELFGHEPGAYTSASSARRGLFELADRGTIFLDEIGELPLELQPRLLRLLEGQPFRRLGGEREVHVDVRIVAATHRDLETMVARGQLRADLLYRLKVLEITIPPLRARRQDVEALAIHFLARLTAEEHGRDLAISPEALALLVAYDWPGNVRELRNVIERAAVVSRGARIEPRHLPTELVGAVEREPAARLVAKVRPSSSAGRGVDDDVDRGVREDLRLEVAIQRHIERAWGLTGGNLSQTARVLDMSRVALRRRLRAYGLVSPGDDGAVVTSEPSVTDRPDEAEPVDGAGSVVTSLRR
ncbi:sigma 54-interacting transcriptional regulator, partial [Myxococcota bacterium]|nr:sigma 54-interacting transcriptional regulator [Myxococcota bacterium]